MKYLLDIMPLVGSGFPIFAIVGCVARCCAIKDGVPESRCDHKWYAASFTCFLYVMIVASIG